MRPNCMSTVTGHHLNSDRVSPEQLTGYHINCDPTACQQLPGITSTVGDCSDAVEALILSTVLLARSFSACDFAAWTCSTAQQLVASLRDAHWLRRLSSVKDKDKASKGSKRGRYETER